MRVLHHSVFLQAGCLSCCPTNSVKALKANSASRYLSFIVSHNTSYVVCDCQPSPSWRKHGDVVTRDGCADLERLVAEGFVPVVHGDALIDDEAGCAILSADTILEVLL